ncbi:MAG: hypothetical protein AB7K67_00240 [Hyphomicrobiaceae bacterium]
MDGSQLAKALADIIRTKPDLNTAFQDTIAKWLKSTALKGAALQRYQEVQKAAGDDFIVWYLKRQVDKDIPALAKKLDPNLPGLKDLGASALRGHLSLLISGKAQPTPKAVKAPKGKTKAPGRPLEDVLRLANPLQRRIELEKLSPAELRAGIHTHSINAGSLSNQPSKTELIEHIQAAIAAGWPEARSVLDDSKY